jgi:Rrf2 family nitric oxide-sensitive transcriptional repressor
MQLTHFTDLGLRVLMYLTHQQRDTPATISEIARQFEVSRHHLVKVVHFMGQRQRLATARGKGGGWRWPGRRVSTASAKWCRRSKA